MKIIAVYGAMPNYDGELSRVLKIVSDTLSELEVEMENISLSFEQIPYYDGVSSKASDDIIAQIKTADGVIFAATSMLYGISAVMRAFLEHLAFEEHNDALRNKNCMTIVCSHSGDERYALDEFSRIINGFGAFDSSKIGISPAVANLLDGDATEIITRQAEDFYRIVRQNRRFIIPGEGGILPAQAQVNNSNVEASAQPVPLGQDISSVYQKLNLGAMTQKQEKDVDDIAQMLSKKRGGQKGKPNAILMLPAQTTEPLPDVGRSSKASRSSKSARLKTCRQMTQGMPHYFQPQMAVGFSASMQINITGAENFEGYLIIDNSDCRYYEGKANAPDITIISDAAVWQEVLTGKSSAQKAFMIGKLKVRGNFVVLTKLEQLFKPMT